MPLFEIASDDLVPFRRVQAGPELYERQVEDLRWDNLDAFTGVQLFPVARQPKLDVALRPDLVALDADGHVYVIEVKRDIARDQLAQCLEYAGWARDTYLDQLAGMFHGGEQVFFAAWTEFTETTAPQLVQRPPRLVLVARDFDDRTDSALAFLTDNDLPVTVLRVTIYQDQDGRQFIDVDADHELAFIDAPSQPLTAPKRYKIEGRRVTVADLLEHNLLRPDTPLVWHRPRLNETYHATVRANGQIELADGRAFSSPSRASMEAADIPAYDGWYGWQVPDGGRLREVRAQLMQRLSGDPGGDDPSGASADDLPSSLD